MQIYRLTEARNLAGIYNSDSDMESDLKFSAWISNRSYRIVDQQDLSAQPKALADGIEVLIIKEKNYVRKS